MTLRKDINESWHLENTFLSLVSSRCQGNDKEAISISRAFFYTPLYHLLKKLGYKYIVLLFTIVFTTQAANGEIVKPIEQPNQEKTELLRTYQLELVELRDRVIRLETEGFIGGYNDLISRYQKIIKQLENDIDRSHSLSSVVKQLKDQQAEIEELKSDTPATTLVYFIFSILTATVVLFFTLALLAVLKDLFRRVK
jgi:hypothetical protein